jgi:ribosomal protein S18 acetylase RimI-like enzyme
MQISFRPYQAADLDACAAVYMETFNGEPWNDQWTLERATQYLEEIVDRRGFVGIVGEDEAKRLTCLMIGHRVSWWNENQFRIHEMAVLPAAQHQGVGQALLKHVKRELSALGYNQLHLITDYHARPAEFYRKAGFAESEELRFFSYIFKPRAVKMPQH